MSHDRPSLAILTCIRSATFLLYVDCLDPRETVSFGFRYTHRRDEGFVPGRSQATLFEYRLASIRDVPVASPWRPLDLGRILFPSFQVLLARASLVDAAARRVRASRGRTSVSSSSEARLSRPFEPETFRFYFTDFPFNLSGSNPGGFGPPSCPRIPSIGRHPQRSPVSNACLKGTFLPIEPGVDGPRTTPTLRGSFPWNGHTQPCNIHMLRARQRGGV